MIARLPSGVFLADPPRGLSGTSSPAPATFSSGSTAAGIGAPSGTSMNDMNTAITKKDPPITAGLLSAAPRSTKADVKMIPNSATTTDVAKDSLREAFSSTRSGDVSTPKKPDAMNTLQPQAFGH